VVFPEARAPGTSRNLKSSTALTRSLFSFARQGPKRICDRMEKKNVPFLLMFTCRQGVTDAHLPPRVLLDPSVSFVVGDLLRFLEATRISQ